MHGDEETPFIIASRLKDFKLDKGSLHIFLGVNPLARLHKKRFIDKDLNRSFPGKEDGKLEERIAFKLLKELENLDLVIDIHCFDMETPLLAIQFEKEDNLVKCFNPKQVWMLNNLDKFSSALGPQLKKKGVRNFAIELDSIEHFDNENRVIEGINNVFRKLGMISEKVIINKPPMKFIRKAVSADISGIFIPSRRPI